jgi:hypothetical protein
MAAGRYIRLGVSPQAKPPTPRRHRHLSSPPFASIRVNSRPSDKRILCPPQAACEAYCGYADFGEIPHRTASLPPNHFDMSDWR